MTLQVPGPGVLNDCFQPGEPRPPAQFLVGPGGPGHQLGRIAIPPFGDVGQQSSACDGLGRFDHLLDRVARSVTEVVDQGS